VRTIVLRKHEAGFYRLPHGPWKPAGLCILMETVVEAINKFFDRVSFGTWRMYHQCRFCGIQSLFNGGIKPFIRPSVKQVRSKDQIGKAEREHKDKKFFHNKNQTMKRLKERGFRQHGPEDLKKVPDTDPPLALFGNNRKLKTKQDRFNR